ncbi:MAG: formylglycine-generating enzyme family protein [Desulfobacterales bacterium]|nr:formylglycine-generating enzyme family protein [Desulfobacterales bacterium]MCP4162694.1 formylglycine-generating enzyme family protein [Deltaproteobacteria bacterium]
MKKYIILLLVFLIVSCDKDIKTDVSRFKKVITNPLGMKFVYIKPGTFMMGPKEEFCPHPEYFNAYQHKVTLTKGFYMQTTEVTVGQWKKFVKVTGFRTQAERNGFGEQMKSDDEIKGLSWKKPGFKSTENHPITMITWEDTQKFIEWINLKEDGGYRLPTEAEWEYSCRAGTNTHFSNGMNMTKEELKLKNVYNDQLGKIAWYRKNSAGNNITFDYEYGHPQPVGLKQPNNWGLYDMHGNVSEYCIDIYIKVFPLEHAIDPVNKVQTTKYRTSRGGFWGRVPAGVTSSRRGIAIINKSTDSDGFRLIKDLEQEDLQKSRKIIK